MVLWYYCGSGGGYSGVFIVVSTFFLTVAVSFIIYCYWRCWPLIGVVGGLFTCFRDASATLSLWWIR